MTRLLAVMVAYTPGRYSGASWDRKISAPATPPSPAPPMRLAEQNARFHWPRMLFAYEGGEGC